MSQTVLIAEDDNDIVELLTLYLSGSGYEVLAAPDGVRALELLQERDVDVALVDIMMPRMNGYDFIKAARAVSDVPIVIVSARSMPADKIVGLDAGADGYITKPFDPLEVTAYIRAMLRRRNANRAAEASGAASGQGTGPARHDPDVIDAALAQSASDTTPISPDAMVCGDLVFDPGRLMLFKQGQPVSLTAAELKIMAALMAAPGRVLSKDRLYAAVNGEPAFGGASSVMVHISNIRAKLEDDPLQPRYIKTVRGLGYRIDG
ncbi:response regulator transcription factor [Collinsella sp. An2]|uniref:response regulator transcription factor n=1 Tax=Collinsella sp. An2 TaxID=1965585 RepID=UPI000B395344|nr:response regulator transcription factor [Collinsella sp. An2]OUP11132.1 DNA-binding response regulator [Collinsella sp. An2]